MTVALRRCYITLLQLKDQMCFCCIHWLSFSTCPLCVNYFVLKLAIKRGSECLVRSRAELIVLLCSYHGWQFRGEDGRATVIPQADDEKRMQAATQSRRSCCTTYPCKVWQACIFPACKQAWLPRRELQEPSYLSHLVLDLTMGANFQVIMPESIWMHIRRASHALS